MVDNMTTFNTSKSKIRQTLKNAEPKKWVDPSQLEEETNIKHADDAEIEEVEFREEEGRYTVTLTNNGLLEVCAVCGMTQAMNKEAMKLYDPQIAREKDPKSYQWDNNHCEQRHKPYIPEWRSGP